MQKTSKNFVANKNINLMSKQVLRLFTTSHKEKTEF